MRSSVVIIPALVAASDQHQDEASKANPVRKVVSMLQAMQKKVEAEASKDKELFDKFMCFCKTGSSDLAKSLSDANIKLPQLASSIEESEAKVVSLKVDLKQAQVDRTGAEAAMAEATRLREKEAAQFAKTSSDLKSNVAAVNKAVAAIDNGMAGAFLQTDAVQILKRIVSTEDMLDADRQDVMAFLTQQEGYAPQSGEISGILKKMGADMASDLKSVTAEEKSSIANYDELMGAKKKEKDALSVEIETKLVRIGDLSVEIVQMKNDLTDTEHGLIEDQKFLKDVQKDCSTKASEYEEIVKTRQEELVALADTIKILNDDDALDLFKKTLPGASASFVQTANDQSFRAAALQAIKKAKSFTLETTPALDFISMCLRGKKIGFDKVIKLIDNMMVTLKQEQTDDDDKKEYCAVQFDLTEDKKKSLEKNISDLEAAIMDAKDGIATLTDEIDKLEDGIKELDKQVAEQTEQRKAEHEDFSELMTSNSAAKELLGFAKNRLNKFYNPKLYKPPAAMLLQISKHQHTKQPEAPQAPGQYKTKSEESSGVIAMLDALISDLGKEITEAETTEKDSQRDYEQAMSDAKEKRASNSKSLTDKKVTKADLKTDLETHEEDKVASGNELMATEGYMSSLHAECDWMLKYFDMRQTARASEIDSLSKAKAVLKGADFSLLETKVGFLKK